MHELLIEIEDTREQLEDLIEEKNDLHDREVIIASKELDKLIHKYLGLKYSTLYSKSYRV